MATIGGEMMKLRTIKELKNGIYRNIELDETRTGMVMNFLWRLYICTYFLYLLLNIEELTFKQTVIGGVICILLLAITAVFGFYFVSCELFIREEDND